MNKDTIERIEREENRKPHRQICSVCNREYAIDWRVPSEVWELATHVSQRNSLICLDCFTRMADTRFVQWDKELEIYPTSLVSQITEVLLPTLGIKKIDLKGKYENMGDDGGIDTEVDEDDTETTGDNLAHLAQFASDTSYNDLIQEIEDKLSTPPLKSNKE